MCYKPGDYISAEKLIAPRLSMYSGLDIAAVSVKSLKLSRGTDISLVNLATRG